MEDDDDNEDYDDDDDEEYDDSESSKKRVRPKRHVIETSEDYMDMTVKDSKAKKEPMTRIEKVTEKEVGGEEKSAANRERMGKEEESLLMGSRRHKIRHLREKVEHLGRQSPLVSAVLAAYCRPERLYLTQFVNCSATEPLVRNQLTEDRNESAESLPPAHAARLLGEAAAAQKSPPGTGLNFKNKISNELKTSHSLIKKTLVNA
jgi:hypothetical protein